MEMDGKTVSLRDVLKDREAREEARMMISDERKERARVAESIERKKYYQGIVTINRAQALCLWDLIMNHGIGAEATVIGADNYGHIRVFVGTGLQPVLYKLLNHGGVEVLDDPVLPPVQQEETPLPTEEGA